MSKTKVLILIGDAGGGHMAPAKVLKQAMEDTYSQSVIVEIVDLFTAVDVAPFNTSNASHELFSQNYTLEVINNLFFRLINTRLGAYLFARYTLSRLYGATEVLIDQIAPDIIVTNNPLVAIVSRELKTRKQNFFSVVQVTDLGTILRFWADEAAEIVFSPAELATQKLIEFGVSPARIRYPLFPIKRNLQQVSGLPGLLKSLGLKSGLFTVLVTGGRVGTNKLMQQAINSIVNIPNIQIIILAGDSAWAQSRMQKKFRKFPHVKVLGFVDDIQNYYALADVVVAKPGTSTILELEALDKMAIFTRRVGEQEEGNVKYLLSNPRFRYLGHNWNTLPALIADLLREQAAASTGTTKQRPLAATTSRRSSDEAGIMAKEIMEAYAKRGLQTG